MEDAQAQLDMNTPALRGPIRLTAPSDLARQVLLPLLDDFGPGAPGVHLPLAVGDRPRDICCAMRWMSPSAMASSPTPAWWPGTWPMPGRWPALRQITSPATARRQHPLDLLQHNCLTFQRNGRPHATWHFERTMANGTKCVCRATASTDDASLARQWAVAGPRYCPEIAAIPTCRPTCRRVAWCRC